MEIKHFSGIDFVTRLAFTERSLTRATSHSASISQIWLTINPEWAAPFSVAWYARQTKWLLRQPLYLPAWKFRQIQQEFQSWILSVQSVQRRWKRKRWEEKKMILKRLWGNMLVASGRLYRVHSLFDLLCKPRLTFENVFPQKHRQKELRKSCPGNVMSLKWTEQAYNCKTFCEQRSAKVAVMWQRNSFYVYLNQEKNTKHIVDVIPQNQCCLEYNYLSTKEAESGEAEMCRER